MFSAMDPELIAIGPTAIIVIAVLIVLARKSSRDAVMGRLRGRWSLIVGSVIGGIALMAALQMGIARLTAPSVDAIVARDPVLAAIFEALPEQEPAIRDRLRRAAGRGEAAIRREAVAIGHEIGVTMMPRLIAAASDDAVLGFIDVFATSMLEAIDRGGTACMSWMTGETDATPMLPFSVETASSMSDAAMRIVVEGAGGKPKRLMEDPDFSRLLGQIVDRAHVLAGDQPLDFDAYADLNSVTDDETKRRVCWTALYLHRSIRELPPERAAALYRTLMSVS